MYIPYSMVLFIIYLDVADGHMFITMSVLYVHCSNKDIQQELSKFICFKVITGIYVFL